jgi:hypothetical protein
MHSKIKSILKDFKSFQETFDLCELMEKFLMFFFFDSKS